MTQKILKIILAVIIVLFVGTIGYLVYLKRFAPVDTSNTTNQTNLNTYSNGKYGFEVKYADAYGVNPLASKDAYPEMNYEKHLADFVDAIQFHAANSDLSCPRLDVQIYASGGKTVDAWLADNPELTQGFSTREAATVGGNPALKFWGPAGDLVPTSMYIVSSNSYIFQLNLDFGLKGEASAFACGDILSGLSFTK